MLKKILLSLAVFIAVINTAIAFYEYLWPLIDTGGEIEVGEYRGLRIGDSKRDVVRKTNNPVFISKLKIVAYRGSGGNTVLVFSRRQSESLWESDHWSLFYPSIHKEMIALTFEDDRLVKITYSRDMLSP